MTKMALRVKPSGSEYLHATSRVNYSQPYAIEHNVKLAEIGVVVAEHVQLLLHYFVTAMGSLPIEDVEVARADQDDD